jgi:hypothetical protein
MCGKSYGKPAKLAQHMRSHTGEVRDITHKHALSLS